MLPLHLKEFPESKDALARALEESLRQYTGKSAPLVSVQSRAFPYFDEISINLDSAKFDSSPLIVSTVAGDTKFACEANLVTLSARNIRVQDAPLDLRLEAHEVLFHKAQDVNDQIVLIVKTVRDGHLRISATQVDLENAINEVARREARKHGITVEQVRLALRARGARSVSVDVRMQARKFLLRANIDISAQLEIDEGFVAKISNLKCKAEGAIGGVVCSALNPHLRRIEGQSLSLKSSPIGDVRLRDVRIAVADTVEVTADFGTAST